MTQWRNEDGVPTQYGYDPNDRLKSVQAPNGASTQYEVDDLGNLR